MRSPRKRDGVLFLRTVCTASELERGTSFVFNRPCVYSVFVFSNYYSALFTVVDPYARITYTNDRDVMRNTSSLYSLRRPPAPRKTAAAPTATTADALYETTRVSTEHAAAPGKRRSRVTVPRKSFARVLAAAIPG